MCGPSEKSSTDMVEGRERERDRKREETEREREGEGGREGGTEREWHRERRETDRQTDREMIILIKKIYKIDLHRKLSYSRNGVGGVSLARVLLTTNLDSLPWAVARKCIVYDDILPQGQTKYT